MTKQIENRVRVQELGACRLVTYEGRFPDGDWETWRKYETKETFAEIEAYVTSTYGDMPITFN